MKVIQQFHHYPAPGPIRHKLRHPSSLVPLLGIYPCLKITPKLSAFNQQ